MISLVLALVPAIAIRRRDEAVERLTRERDEARAEVKSLRREIEEARSELFAARVALQPPDRPMRPHPYELLQMAQQAQQAQQAQHQLAMMNQQQHAQLAAYQGGLQSQLGAVPFCNCVPARGDFLLGQLDPPF
jgi:predicted  nucleic acid-binding Zn-ribbon protein